MKQVRVFLLPPGWDASPSQGYPRDMSPVPIYTAGWRETMWGKVSCLRKQHDGRNWASNHRLSDLKFNTLTTTPPHPHNNVGRCRIRLTEVLYQVLNLKFRPKKIRYVSLFQLTSSIENSDKTSSLVSGKDYTECKKFTSKLLHLYNIPLCGSST